MTLGQRLKKFIDSTYGTQRNFASVIGINHKALNRYILDKTTPGADMLLKFKIAGMSIDWLLDGSGSMYCINPYELRESIGSNINDIETPHERIEKWILKYYHTFENFSATMNIDIYRIKKLLFNDMMADPEFIFILKKAGCNIAWLSSGEGTHFSETVAGNILRNKIEFSQSIFNISNNIDENN